MTVVTFQAEGATGFACTDCRHYWPATETRAHDCATPFDRRSITLASCKCAWCAGARAVLPKRRTTQGDTT